MFYSNALPCCLRIHGAIYVDSQLQCICSRAGVAVATTFATRVLVVLYHTLQARPTAVCYQPPIQGAIEACFR